MAHITSQQRYTICVLLQKGETISQIASIIGKNKSVVSREIRRNRSPKTGVYNCEEAQEHYQTRKRERHRPRRLTPQIEGFIRAKIRQDYSPEQIVGYAKRMKIPCVSITTIYSYIWSDKADYSARDKLFHHLRVGRKKAIKEFGKRTGLGTIPNRRMISERPSIVDSRSRYGDFEADTMWIANKAVIVTVNDRATGVSHIRALNDRKADRVNQAIYEMVKDEIGSIKTLTVDNGKEFYKHGALAELIKADVYFADPYSSWQRGSNENLNKLYRQYFPRNMKLENITEDYVRQVEHKLNTRPRKRYGYRTPLEMYDLYTKNQSLHL